MTDPTTIAFLAIGAYKAIQERGTVGDFEGGQLGLVAEVILNAPMLDDAYEDYEDVFAGVFAYDVAEEFGYVAAKAYMDGDVTRFDMRDGLALAYKLITDQCVKEH